MYEAGIASLKKKLWPLDPYKPIDSDKLLWATQLTCTHQNWIIIALRNGFYGPPQDASDVAAALGVDPKEILRIEHQLYHTTKVFYDGDPKPHERPPHIELTPSVEARLMTKKEVRLWLRIGIGKLMRLIQDGLPHFRLDNGEYRFKKAQLETWLLRYSGVRPQPRRRNMSVTFTISDPTYVTISCPYCKEIEAAGGEIPCIPSCDGTDTEQTEPSANFSNVNAFDLLEMIDEHPEKGDVYGEWSVNKLADIRRKILWVLNTPLRRKPYIQAPSQQRGKRGALVINAGITDEQILRRLNLLFTVVTWAQEHDKPIVFG